MSESAAQPERLRLRRLAATLLDLLILIPTGLLLMLVSGIVESAEAWVMPQPIIRLSGLAVVTYLLLNGYPLLTQGQTLGKRIMRIRLARASDGARLPAWRLALRAAAIPTLALLLSLELLVPLYLITALTIFLPGQRTLQDHFSGSRVVAAD